MKQWYALYVLLCSYGTNQGVTIMANRVTCPVGRLSDHNGVSSNLHTTFFYNILTKHYIVHRSGRGMGVFRGSEICTVSHILSSGMKSVVPEEGINGSYRQIHHTVCMGCNYLSLPLTHASDTFLIILWDVITCPCPWNLLLVQNSS